MAGIKDYFIRRLWDLGHFHNPARPTGVDASYLPRLELHDNVVQEAVKSFQEMMRPTLREATQALFNREELIDGEIGPATAEVFATPRCGFPDYPVPGGALAAGPLEANWPTSCRTRLRFGRNFKSLPGLTEANTHLVWWGSANNWFTALKNFDMQPTAVGDQAGSHVYCDLGALAGSTLAWSYLAQNNCSARLAQRFNSRTNWNNMLFAVTVKTHEDGHALGFDHNNDGNALMYPSINRASQERGGFPNATDLATAKRNGYELSGATSLERSKLFTPRPWGEVPEPPTPEPPSGGFVLSGTLTLIDANGQIVQEYIPTPKLKA